jgi:hypothetical protein
MTKRQAEKDLPHLFDKWRDEAKLAAEDLEHPSYSDFKRWAQENGYSRYWDFRSVAGADYDIEAWFDEHFAQMWRR